MRSLQRKRKMHPYLELAFSTITTRRRAISFPVHGLKTRAVCHGHKVAPDV